MKRLFIALTITAAGFFTTASAKDPVTRSALDAFNSTYTHAKEVQWKDIGEGFKASFQIDGKYVAAYYTPDGSWIGTTRNIAATELSPKLKNNLRRELKGAWLNDLFVLNTNDGDVYFATIESADATKVLKSKNGRKWELYKNLDK